MVQSLVDFIDENQLDAAGFRKILPEYNGMYRVNITVNIESEYHISISGPSSGLMDSIGEIYFED